MASKFLISLQSLAWIFLITCQLQEGAAQEPNVTNWISRLRNDGKDAWAKYRVESKRIQGSAIGRYFKDGAEKQPVIVSTTQFKQAPNCALVEHAINLFENGRSNPQPEEIAARNEKYSFKLRRKDEVAPWVLIDYFPNLDTTSLSKPSSDAVHRIDGILSWPIAMNYNAQDDWPHVLAHVGTKILSATLVEDKDETLIKAEFELAWIPSQANPVRVIGRGRVWFDSQHYWVMRKCEYRVQRGPNGKTYDHKSSYEYKINQEGYPLLKRFVDRVYDSDNTVIQVKISDLALDFADLTEQDFKLSSFGLLEPVTETPPPRNRNWLWVTITVVVVIGVAYLLRRKIKSLEAKPS